MSPRGPRCLSHEACECGRSRTWKAHGIIRRRWRIECFCGRSGPWEPQPKTEFADAYIESFHNTNRIKAGITTTPPPPKPRR